MNPQLRGHRSGFIVWKRPLKQILQSCPLFQNSLKQLSSKRSYRMIWFQLVHMCLSVAGLIFYTDQECILTFDIKFKCRNLIMNTEIMIALFGFHPDFPNFPYFKSHYHTWKLWSKLNSFVCITPCITQWFYSYPMTNFTTDVFHVQPICITKWKPPFRISQAARK